MKPERALVAQRALAEHCPELVRKGRDPADLLPLLGRMGERLARRLSGVLAPLMGGEAPVVRCQSARQGTLESLRDAAMSPLAANSLFGLGQGRVPLLISLDAEPVLRIVDRAFGGKGDAPRPMPERFPMAADLMIGKLETLISAQIAAAVEAVAPAAQVRAGCPALTPLRRDGSLATLEPFAEGMALAILPIEIEDDGILPWELKLALPLAALPLLFGTPDDNALPAARAPADPLDAPFAELPLPVRAVIVDMVLPFATIARLAPGQILPVSVARNVPLHIGDATFAHGTVGAVDDRVALQITDSFQA